MDTNLSAREEIVLLTRYLLKDLRRLGYKSGADKIARQANIDEQQPLVGSMLEHAEAWRNGCSGMDFWIYFCHKKLKALREHTFQGEALTVTTTNQQPLSADPSRIENSNFPRMFSASKEKILVRLKEHILSYVVRDLYKESKDLFVKKQEIDAKEAAGAFVKEEEIDAKEAAGPFIKEEEIDAKEAAGPFVNEEEIDAKEAVGAFVKEEEIDAKEAAGLFVKEEEIDAKEAYGLSLGGSSSKKRHVKIEKDVKEAYGLSLGGSSSKKRRVKIEK